MDNYDSPGEIVNCVVPAGGVVAGLGYKIGDLVCIATVDAAAGVTAAFYVGRGVVVVAKVSAQAWTQNQKIYWDNTAFNFTNVVGTNTLVGTAAAPAANPSATGKVRLDGVAR
jgi:predicted RecA/RadA family phage recombinase